MEKSKESNNQLSGFFKIKYRILPVYEGYKRVAVIVQCKRWWFPIWIDAWSNMIEDGNVKSSTIATFESVDDAMHYINARKQVF